VRRRSITHGVRQLHRHEVDGTNGSQSALTREVPLTVQQARAYVMSRRGVANARARLLASATIRSFSTTFHRRRRSRPVMISIIPSATVLNSDL